MTRRRDVLRNLVLRSCPALSPISVHYLPTRPKSGACGEVLWRQAGMTEVMAGLHPAIHAFLCRRSKDVDARNKSAHDADQFGCCSHRATSGQTVESTSRPMNSPRCPHGAAALLTVQQSPFTRRSAAKS